MKRVKWCLVLLLTGLLLFVGACGSPDTSLPPDAPVPPTTPEPIGPDTVIIDEPPPSSLDVADYPEYLDLSIGIDSIQSQEHFDAMMNGAVGDDFIVTLGSNPTTGFEWSAEISDETMLTQTDHRYEPAKEENIVGGAGEEVWTFEALKKGTATINMEYSRP